MFQTTATQLKTPDLQKENQ